MDTLNIDGSINSPYTMKLDDKGRVVGFGFIQPKPTQSQQILPMIEQRIRDEVEPRAQQAEKDLIAIINIELVKLGIKVHMTSTHQYAKGIADKYRERLVGERIEAIVDGLTGISAKP